MSLSVRRLQGLVCKFGARGGSSPATIRNAIGGAWYHNDADKKDAKKIEFTTPFETYLCDGPKEYAMTTEDEVMKYFRDMVVLRRMEIVADQLYKKAEIRGFCHLYDGQEAVCTGLEAGSGWQHYLITAYRDHGTQLARGDTVERIMAELFGKRTGSTKGKGGSMHLYHPENRFYGGHGIVGAQTALGTGLAFAAKYRGENVVSITMYGDGAANQGQLAEAMNMAALWKLPVVYVCENNNYGMGTSTARSAADNRYYTRGHYIPGVKVDGMDILAVREATMYAVDHCQQGNGPIILEMNTYRYHGHSMSDPGISYRSRDEVQSIRAKRDPIERAKAWLVEVFNKDPAELKAIEKEVRKSVDEETNRALAADLPNPDELYTQVFSTADLPIRGTEISNGVNWPTPSGLPNV